MDSNTASSGKTLPHSSDKEMPFQPTCGHPWEKLPDEAGVTQGSWGESGGPEGSREEGFGATPTPPHPEKRIPDLDLVNFPYIYATFHRILSSLQLKRIPLLLLHLSSPHI